MDRTRGPHLSAVNRMGRRNLLTFRRDRLLPMTDDERKSVGIAWGLLEQVAAEESAEAKEALIEQAKVELLRAVMKPTEERKERVETTDTQLKLLNTANDQLKLALEETTHDKKDQKIRRALGIIYVLLQKANPDNVPSN